MGNFPGECVEWRGPRAPQGYGRIRGRNVAHRVAWELANGREVPAGMLVRHRCDNPPCVNPEHLLLGTAADNARDMVERGRSTRGERNHTAKLTAGQVYETRALADQGWCQADIARAYGVSEMNISNIVRRKIWTHLPEEQSALA